MVGCERFKTDDSPLAQVRVQWTLAIGTLLSLVALVGLCGWSLLGIEPPRGMQNHARLLLLDINEAGSTELSLLPTVGPVLADRIVTDRIRHGPFETVEQLQRVAGIGPKTVQAITPYCVVKLPSPTCVTTTTDALP
ncbi:ComE operon protein 1 [Novipirellula artificiosorum]|uniref:ComE operon protein 1 n=2 Tax=Novipirellula artificiosorum TaxID=2528016 RepID=A0A5C6DZW1_9BACT|nr:ComE operon protein 1 [Novipirellula artificiosorum]